MAQDVAEVKAPERNDKERLDANNRQIEKLNRQLANLLICVLKEIFPEKSSEARKRN